MTLPDLAVINFSDVPEGEARRAIRSVNRQVADDFLPIWGAGYHCRLHRQPDTPLRRGRHPGRSGEQPVIIEPDPINAEAYHNRGVLYEKRGDRDAARSAVAGKDTRRYSPGRGRIG